MFSRTRLVFPGKHALVENTANEDAARFFAEKYDVATLLHSAHTRDYGITGTAKARITRQEMETLF